MLEREYAFYKENNAKLAERYLGKFVVIVGEEVVGSYNDQPSAYSWAIGKYPLGTFLIQEITKDPSQAIQRFTSLVYV